MQKVKLSRYNGLTFNRKKLANSLGVDYWSRVWNGFWTSYVGSDSAVRLVCKK